MSVNTWSGFIDLIGLSHSISFYKINLTFLLLHLPERAALKAKLEDLAMLSLVYWKVTLPAPPRIISLKPKSCPGLTECTLVPALGSSSQDGTNNPTEPQL